MTVAETTIAGAAAATPDTTPRPGPFDLADDRAYRAWRAARLAGRPRSLADATVDVADPRALRPAERAALLDCCARFNLAVYRSPVHDADPEIPRRLGAALGLHRLDANWLADEDGISRIEAGAGAEPGSAPRADYIPYTTRAIGWHTDGYYHPDARRIRAMILHCVRPAARGGVNRLLDHELVYIALRDADPAWIRALMAPDAMTIPAREGDDGVARPAQTGPVFSVDPLDGRLHLRYTARTRSIAWRHDATTAAAAAALARALQSPADMLTLRLAPGMGIVANNVLHDRSAFDDDPAAPRLLYRARYLDRVADPDRGDAARAALPPAVAVARPSCAEAAWHTG
jgi:alpha-ketoglutarate-dependent taurine dioxygenase